MVLDLIPAALNDGSMVAAALTIGTLAPVRTRGKKLGEERGGQGSGTETGCGPGCGTRAWALPKTGGYGLRIDCGYGLRLD